MALLERLIVEEVQPFVSVDDIPPGTRYVPEPDCTTKTASPSDLPILQDQLAAPLEEELSGD
jgi:hypothetical protein